MHRHTLARVFINDGKHPVAAAPEQAVLNEIHTPDVVRIQGMHANNRMLVII